MSILAHMANEDKLSSLGNLKDTLAKLVQAPDEEVAPALRMAYACPLDDPPKRWKMDIPVIVDLKVKGREHGLWDMFLSKRQHSKHGVDMTNLEYAVMVEMMGRGGQSASEVHNRSAFDTGNMEAFARYASPEQERWLVLRRDTPCVPNDGAFRPKVASSDLSIRQEGNEIDNNGHEW
ncbi:hypothetical protein BC835DRAFT_1417366 [Cytidiella melzeri]|nr:hypothetical protein BC835DRAFT_1417366 [Cytidiella melzeri]